MRRYFLLVFWGGVTLTSCQLHTVDVDVKPQIVTSNVFLAQDIPPDNGRSKDTSWWQVFNRPLLNSLMHEALENNNTLSAAISRVKQSRALYRQTRADLFPKVYGQAGVDDYREGGDDQASTREVGLSASWELDVFNRIGAAALSDSYETLSMQQDMEAVRLSLTSEVALAYFGAVAAHNRLSLLEEQLETDNELLELIELRQQHGIGTSIEVLQQQGQVAESLSLMPQAEADLRVFENRLDVLAGVAPDGVNRVRADDSLGFVENFPAIGVPADLLFNRPDLRAAHASLIAADANIASAIAERLPQITLTGSYLYSDTSTFSGPLATIAAAFVQPLLDWGERKAVVEQNKELYQERLFAYTQRYLEAIEEVENTLYQENKQREYLSRLENRRKILSDTVQEAEALYEQGIEDYFLVLNALQDLREIERNIISEQLNLVNFRINLHRAIGGTVVEQETL